MLVLMTTLQQQHGKVMSEALTKNIKKIQHVSQENQALCDIIYCLERVVETKKRNVGFRSYKTKIKYANGI
jgi:hypothetical protein